MKTEDVNEPYEPFNTLSKLIGEYGMATVLKHLSEVADYVSEHLSIEDVGDKDLQQCKISAKQLSVDLAELAARARGDSDRGSDDPRSRQQWN